MSDVDGSNLLWRDPEGRPLAHRCYECGQPATVEVWGPINGPVTFVCDQHGGVLRPLVEASLARLNRGQAWPRPIGVIRLELNLLACSDSISATERPDTSPRTP
jgi:hypothetical protein